MADLVQDIIHIHRLHHPHLLTRTRLIINGERKRVRKLHAFCLSQIRQKRSKSLPIVESKSLSLDVIFFVFNKKKFENK